MRRPGQEIHFFGDGEQLSKPVCSWCGEPMPDDEDDDYEVPILLWRNGGAEMARLHVDCFSQCLELQLISLPVPNPPPKPDGRRDPP